MDTQETLLRELLAQYPAPSMYPAPKTPATAPPSHADTIIQRSSSPTSSQISQQNLHSLSLRSPWRRLH